MVLPGGFSYGDYLRCGAIARFAPGDDRGDRRRQGRACRCSASATASRSCASPTCCPGALIRNDHRKFGCLDQRIAIENNTTAWTTAYAAGQELTIVLKNGEGSYVADQQTLDMLEAEGRVVARYAGGNPNGSQRAIAGVTNEAGNVVGLMPHPEHAVEDLCGPGTDGLGFFTSVGQPPSSASPDEPSSASAAAPPPGRAQVAAADDAGGLEPDRALVGATRRGGCRRRRCRSPRGCGPARR